MTKPWYQYIYFSKVEKSAPNIFILRRFFKYIGGRLCGVLGVADSLNKLGAYLEILSELVPTLETLANRTCSMPSARSSANSARRAISSLDGQACYRHQAMLLVQNTLLYHTSQKPWNTIKHEGFH